MNTATLHVDLLERLFRYVVLSALILAPMPARAEEIDVYNTEMTFVIVREAEAQCEPLCPEWISAFGSIQVDTDDKLEAVFTQMGDRHLPIIIESPGGNLDKAIELGRMIRAKGLSIAVGHTRYTKCRPERHDCEPMFSNNVAYAGTAQSDNARCDSACAYVFAGGVKRFIGAQSTLGVHLGIGSSYSSDFSRGLHRVEANDEEAIRIATTFKPQAKEYFTDMGIRPELVPTIFSSVKLIELSQARLAYYNLTTGDGDSDQLVDAVLCHSTPPAENCILRE